MARLRDDAPLAAYRPQGYPLMISALYESPVGTLTLISNGAALEHLEFENPRYPFESAPRGADKILDQVRRELDDYFAGKLREFAVAVAPQGTLFQRSVWSALLTIPYGATRSYSQQALAIGSPRAARAVGLANGRNPISIIIPCHRVIGADGGLTGYGGGIEKKRFLLDLEAERLAGIAENNFSAISPVNLSSNEGTQPFPLARRSPFHRRRARHAGETSE